MLNFSKFLHSQSGKYVMSILLGFGLATLFRAVCKEKNCVLFHAPPLEKFQDKVYRNNSGKCVKYNAVATKCNSNAKTVDFE